MPSTQDRPAFPPGGPELLQRVARLAELGVGSEFVTVPCGGGVTTRFIAEATGASGAGVDPDEDAIEAARAEAREQGLEQRLHFEHAPAHDLPYKDAVFDLAIGEMGISGASNIERAVAELARVTRPMGAVVLIQLTWSRALPPAERDRVVEWLGLCPFMLVEWKQMLRDAGVVELQVEDWSDALVERGPDLLLGGGSRAATALGRWGVYLDIWRSQGWSAVRDLQRHRRTLQVLTGRDRALGLSLIKGTRWTG